MSLHDCPDPTCDRKFLDVATLAEHAEAVHTFDDVRMAVADALREAFGRAGDYRASPVVPSIWVYVQDIADDWVVFQYENGDESSLQKCSYTIVDGSVTLGDPVEVTRRTVYEAKSDGEPAVRQQSDT